MRPIRGYNNMSKERLLSILSESESAKNEKNFDNVKIKRLEKILIK